MPKQRQVVRVVAFEFNDTSDIYSEAEAQFGQFIECLRYAGVVHVQKVDDKPSRLIIDILPPKNSGNDRVWAEANAERMQTFGYNAVPAPEGRIGDSLDD